MEIGQNLNFESKHLKLINWSLAHFQKESERVGILLRNINELQTRNDTMMLEYTGMKLLNGE